MENFMPLICAILIIAVVVIATCNFGKGRFENDRICFHDQGTT